VFAAVFAAAGVGIGCAGTAEHATVAVLAPGELRGSAFRSPGHVKATGNMAASAVAGTLYTVISPQAAFTYPAVWIFVVLATLGCLVRTSSR
jgi:hypothetical protein